MDYSRKKQRGAVCVCVCVCVWGGGGWVGKGGGKDILFENLPGISMFFTLPLEIPDKASFTPRNSTKLCYTPREF